MPLAQITLVEGASDEQRRTLIERTTRAIADNLAIGLEAARVILQEVPATHWGVGGVSVHERRTGKQ